MKLLGLKTWLLYLIVEIELTRTTFFRLFGFQGLFTIIILMNKDFLKEKISFIKLWTTILMAIVVGSTAWVVNNLDKILVSLSIATIIMVIIFIIIVLLLTRKAYRLIKEMKNTETRGIKNV